MAAQVSNKPQLGPEGSDASAAAIENHPSKLLLSHFVYKACLVTVFLVLIPLFPSLAPDFFNQTLHARSWEVLQLIFVGIAVSYGLFSKKNDNEPPQKDHNHNPQSYLSKLLQVSSVFDDDDDESQSQETHTSLIQENNSNKTLNSSQYYRGQSPVVVVPKQEKNEGVVSEITQKPLLLPVRSLRTTENKGKLDENVVVLPSPIPWRSRSGRLETEEATGDDSQQLSNRIESRSFRSNSSSPSKSESPIRKKGVTAPQPPPPPPPPPQIRRKSMLMKSNSAISNDSDSRDREIFRRSVSSVAETELPKRPNSESVRTFRYGKEEEKKNEVADKVFVESTDEDEDDDFNEDFMEAGKSNGRDDDGGPDVDKKADEFIAKFREQIRLQRIESIRRTTALRSSTGNKLNSK